MNNRRSTITVFVTVLMLMIGGVILLPRLMFIDAYVGNDCLRYKQAIVATHGFIAQTPDGAKREELVAHVGDYLQQAQDAGCRNELEGAGVSFGSIPAPSGAPTLTPTPSSTASASTAPSSDAWTPHWYTLDAGKTAPRNFGPPVVAKSSDDATTQWYERMTLDPSLLCEDGGMIVNEPSYITCVKQVMASKTARDAYIAKVKDNVAKTELVTLPAVAASKSAYMVMGQDGIPRIVAVTVDRSEPYQALKVTTKDGRTFYFRLLCGFQWDEPQHTKVVVTVRRTPPPSVKECINGGERDSNGKCVTVDVCRQSADGTWHKLFGIKPSARRASDESVNSPKCKSTPPCPPWKDGTVPKGNPDGSCPKDPGVIPSPTTGLPQAPVSGGASAPVVPSQAASPGVAPVVMAPGASSAPASGSATTADGAATGGTGIGTPTG